MSKFLLLLIILLSSLNTFSQQPQWSWVKNAGGFSDDVGRSITCDNDANLIVCGLYNDVAYFGSFTINSNGYYGGQFLTKIDSLGNFLWVKKISGTGQSNSTSVITDSLNNIYIAGGFAGTIFFDTITKTSSGSADFFVAKYGKNGNLIWLKTAGGIDMDASVSIVSIVSNSNGIYLSGEFNDSVYFDSTLLVSHGGSDIFIAQMDFNGNYNWLKQAGGPDWDVNRGIALDKDSNIIITGIFMSNCQFDDTVISSYGLSDAYVAKYKLNGQFKWVRKMGGIYSDFGLSVTCTPDNSINVHGLSYSPQISTGSINLVSAGNTSYFISKLSSDGNFIWSKLIGGMAALTENTWNRSIISDEYGNLYITSSFKDTLFYDNIVIPSTGSYDIFILKTDNNGNLIWYKTVGNNNPDGDYSCSITRDMNNNLYVTGRFYDMLSFGTNTVGSWGSADVYVAKLHEEPVSVNYLTLNPESQIRVYPNPATDEFSIFHKKGNIISRIEILNAQGSLCSEYQTFLKDNFPFKINISDFAKGIYFIKVISDSGIEIIRLIKL